MKIKKEYLILGLIIVTLVAYLVLRNTDRTHYRLPVLEKVSPDEITKIRIKGPEATIELSKKADRWVISPEGYPANAGKVKQMLDIIDRLTLTALVSESKNYDRYDLTDEKKIAVKAWAGDTLKREFELGKVASSFKHTFVKIAGDHRVYHARESFRFTFDETVDSMRDKTVLDFEIKDIGEIRVTENGQLAVFKKSDTPAPDTGQQAKEDGDQKTAKSQPVWQRSNGEKLDAAEVNRLLTTLDGLECDRYIYDRQKDDFKDPIYTITLKGTGTHVLSLFARPGKADSENYPAVSSDNAYPFELTQFRAESIMKTFKKEEAKKAENKPEKP